jgi:hypothetical protein
MVYNNTLVANNHDFTGTDSDFESALSPAFTGIFQRNAEPDSFSILNNIIIGHNVVEVVLRLNANPTVTIDHNLYGNDAFSNFRTNYAWVVYTLSEWQDVLANRPNVVGDEQHSFIADDPLFVSVPSAPSDDHSQYDFTLSTESLAIDAGRPLTHTVGSGTGNQIVVGDARYFYDGYGIAFGDVIRIGSRVARIKAIDYEENILTITRDISWSDGDGVSLNYFGLAPDIGAREYFEIPVRRGRALSPAPLFGVTSVSDALTAQISPTGSETGGIPDQIVSDSEIVDQAATRLDFKAAPGNDERLASPSTDLRLLGLIVFGIITIGASVSVARRKYTSP